MLGTRSSLNVRRALAETVSWCSSQPLKAEVAESYEIRRRRTLINDAAKLSAKLVSNSNFSFDSDEWQRTKQMFKEGDASSLALLSEQLRSKALKPSTDIGDLIPESDREQAVGELISKRSIMLNKQDLSNGFDEITGKLLIYIPSETVSDGWSEYASNGFFDVNDAPPWDTWFHYSNKELLCWVPSLLVPLVQKGIDGNAVDCIRWTDWAILIRLEQ